MMSASDIKDIINSIQPVISGGGNLYIGGDVNAPIIINNAEASTIKQNCNEELKKIESPVCETRRDVLLKLNQINEDINKKTTKGTIKEIANKSIPVVMPLNIWNEIMNTNENPLYYFYLVNVKYYEIENIYIVTDLLGKSLMEGGEESGLFLEKETN